MKVAFLGIQSAFDYYQIGGVESFVRRISRQLVDRDTKVDYVLYGADVDRSLSPYEGLTLKYFTTFEKALSAISEDYEHVLTIYLLPKHRRKFASFRKKIKGGTRFHFIYFGWPDSLIKRKLYFSEARLIPYNGKLFCISKRQYEYVKRWTKNAVFILPPVPDDYFLKPEEKPKNYKLRVTFLGRIDPGKGINDVIKLFEVLKGHEKYEINIYGIHISESKESLAIHQWLKKQEQIQYHEVDRQDYSPQVDEFVRTVLQETDIFIQPYLRLSSTIDTPLLLLESMASLCAVITKPFGNIPDTYGESKFLIPEKRFFPDATNLLSNISTNDIQTERERIYVRNNKLNFKANYIAQQFIELLNE